jgi:uncharacterized protein YbjT (DUF2867 family)
VSDLPALAITGSTGALGGLVARDLAERGVAQRLLCRDPGRSPELAGATAVRADYGEVALSIQALLGAKALFMVSGHEGQHRVDQHRAFVRAALDAGVEHIVYTSLFGCRADSTFTLARDHFHTERMIRESGMRWTFLRDNFYADVFPFFADEHGVIRGPAGDGRVGAVARADVARSAAAVLSDPAAHAGVTYDLTGPEALTLGEMAEILAEVKGRPFTFVDETVEEAYASRAKWNAEPWQLDSWVSTYTAFAAGEFDGVSDDVRRLTDRAPASFREVVASASAG